MKYIKDCLDNGRQIAFTLSFFLAVIGSPAIAQADTLREAWSAYNQGNFERAVDIWQNLAAAGNADALYNLGVMYRDGKGVVRDTTITHSLWTLAADKKHVRAMHNLALAYIAGDVTLENQEGPNYPEAIALLEKAADQSFPNSLYTLGKLYGYGLGTKRDKAKEISYYLLAAKAGSSKAQYNMGKAHRDGDGVVKDDKIAASYFLQAAEQGHSLAQNHLATRYASGVGVEKNDIMALKWALIAEKNGNSAADDNITALKLRMSDLDIAKATELANGFEPKPTKYVKPKKVRKSKT